jgi:DNA-directed RNA polymerase subunit RPC12/RpoP
MMNTQVKIYSVDTKSFYDTEEEKINKQIIGMKLMISAIEEYTLFQYVYKLNPKECGKYGFEDYLDYYKQKKGYKIKKDDNGNYISLTDKQRKQQYHSKYLKKFMNKLKKEYKNVMKTKEFKDLLKQNNIYKKYMQHEKGEFNLHDKLKSKLADLISKNNEIRVLNPNKVSKYNIVAVFDSSLSRTLQLEKDKFTNDIMIVRIYHYDVLDQILKKGYDYLGEHYIALTASAGQIRTKKIVMIKESLWKQYENTFMCGLTIDIINNSSEHGCNINKFLSYLALLFSASDKWEGFDIDRAIVLPDFETGVEGKVDYINHKTFKIKKNRKMKVMITHSDGCGWILPSESKISFMVRLPWMKGLLTPCDFLKYCRLYRNDNYKVVDIDGKEWDLKADNIKYVFFKSQFKMNKYYKNCYNSDGTIHKYGWDIYKECFKKFNCSANICNPEPKYKKDYKRKSFNYQMWQSITDYKEEELDELTEGIIDYFNNAYTDKDTMLDVLGVNSKKKTYLQEALSIYPELLRDSYIQSELSSILNSKKKEAKYAKFPINSAYTYFIPDVFAWMEFSLSNKENPEGILKNDEVYCSLFDDKELIVNRSPHLYKDHAVRSNIYDKSIRNQWFITNGVYTSCHDLISKTLQFDVDGDKALVVAEPKLISLVKRNMVNVVPLYYKMGKAEPKQINPQNIYDSLVSAFAFGNIGKYSNNITTLWNREGFINNTIESENKNDINYDSRKKRIDNYILYAIKLLTALNNYSIDAAKTLEMPTLPTNIQSIINEASKYFYKQEKEVKGKKKTIVKSKKIKLPYFFKYAKDKTDVEPINNSIVNKICYKIENLKQGDYDWSNVGYFRYTTLMNNPKIEINEKVTQEYERLNKEMQKYFFKNEDLEENEIACATWEIMQYEFNCFCQENNMNYVDAVDMIIKYIFKFKRDSKKELLFKVFGDVIVNNLKANINKPLDSGYIQCQDCGKRVKKTSNRQIRCEECSDKVIHEKDRNRKNKKAIPYLDNVS